LGHVCKQTHVFDGGVPERPISCHGSAAGRRQSLHLKIPSILNPAHSAGQGVGDSCIRDGRRNHVTSNELPWRRSPAINKSNRRKYVVEKHDDNAVVV